MSEADRWTEVSFSSDGIGVTLYKERENSEVQVVEETWLTLDELEERLESQSDNIVLSE